MKEEKGVHGLEGISRSQAIENKIVQNTKYVRECTRKLNTHIEE